MTVVVHILIPVHDTDGNPYPRPVLQRLQRDLEERFGGWTLGHGEPARERSCCYEVSIPRERLGELDAYLAELAYRLGQERIWRVLHGDGEARSIRARPPAQGSVH